MLTSIPLEVIAAILGAIAIHHLAARFIVRRWSGPLRDGQAAAKRAEARLAELGDFKTVAAEADAKIKIYEEEGVSARPSITFMAAVFGMFVAVVTGVSVAMFQLGGPLADVVWWVGPVFVVARFSVNLFRSARKNELSGAGLIVAMFIASFFAAGFALVYAFLPLGTIAYLMLSSVVAGVLWKLFPPRADELPPVAMLFL